MEILDAAKKGLCAPGGTLFQLPLKRGFYCPLQEAGTRTGSEERCLLSVQDRQPAEGGVMLRSIVDST